MLIQVLTDDLVSMEGKSMPTSKPEIALRRDPVKPVSKGGKPVPPEVALTKDPIEPEVALKKDPGKPVPIGTNPRRVSKEAGAKAETR